VVEEPTSGLLACLPAADMGSGLKYRAGLCLIVAVVLIWVLSAEVTQVRCGFCNPYALYLFILIGGSWILAWDACLLIGLVWFGSFRA